MNCDHYKYFRQFFKKRFYTEPTNLDTLMFTIELAHQVGIKKSEPSFRFLNINQGCIVLEILGGICIAKTFLSTEMVQNDSYIQWYDFEKHFLEEISDCIDPSEDCRAEFELLSEEVPVGYCANFFKKL